MQDNNEIKEKNLSILQGHQFEPETYRDREFVDFLNYLVENKDITSKQMQVTLAEYSVAGESIGIILVRNSFIRHPKYIERLIEFNPDSIMHEQTISEIIEPEFLIETNTMVIAETKKTIYLSTLSDEMEIMSEIEEIDSREVIFLPADIDILDMYISKLKKIVYGEESFVDEIIKKALKQNASDIHVIPKAGSYSIMYRIDGVKTIIHEGDLDECQNFMARVKDRSKMDIAEKRTPQDGGFQVENNGKLIDMRVATIPVINGEQMVIRLLDPDSVEPDLESLGISEIKEWKKGVSRPDGIALICGPTGSGKTTTLQASIRAMDRFGRAIYTIEDPVEYRIPYVAQVNINAAVGLDFPRGIRAFMRADPDVIMVGEIRDEETARNAIKVAETGHLCVGTLHTNSIRSSIDRLRDIGVSNKEMRYILRTVLVQKLVRKICTECKGDPVFSEITGYEKTCQKCNGSGYSGRTVVSECKYFSDEKEVDLLIEGKVSWTQMVDDAIDKIGEGITDSAEILRVFGEEGKSRMDERGIEYKEVSLI